MESDQEKAVAVQNRLASCKLLLEAALNEFLAAVICDDPKEQESQRVRAHAIVDAQLDGLSDFWKLSQRGVRR